MNRLWRTILAITILDFIYCNRYFVSGVLNQSCVTYDGSCSVCCAGHTCFISDYYPNHCSNGCIDGHRGARCYELCTYNCRKCDLDINKCDSCFDGFYLGKNKECTSKCLPTCKNCSSSTSCISCKEGFYNKDGSSDCRYPFCPTNCKCNNGECVACKPYFYDINKLCTSKCPDNCLECSSDLQCSSCKDGFYNDNGQSHNCASSCRENCTTCTSYDVCLQCQSGKFGKQCQSICSVGCRNKECAIETGNCNCRNNFSGERCTQCVSGFYRISCDRKCPYNCNNEICGNLSGACTAGCKSDTMTGSYCENCVAGKYGISCDDICPEKCLDEKCYKKNGTCSEGCKEGFEGSFCLECVRGKYGDDCKDDCPDNCKDIQCEKQLGHCFNCTGNFDGNMCDNCKPGFYGSSCDRICSSKCVSNSCDKETGKCIHGCEDNYSGDKCCVNNMNCFLCTNNTICQECSPGYFGETCNQGCSDLCINNVCEIETGICALGCTVSLNSRICVRSQGNTEDGDKCESKGTTIAVLATLFSVSTFALCILISVMMIRNCLSSKRTHEESMVLGDFESKSTYIQNTSERGEIGDGENVPYDTLDETRFAIDDHKYESANTNEIENKKTETYVNMSP